VTIEKISGFASDARIQSSVMNYFRTVMSGGETARAIVPLWRRMLIANRPVFHSRIESDMSQRRTTLVEFTAEMVEALTPVGEVHSHPMFGGYGIFESGTMFVLIDRNGTLFFRADSTTKSRYEAAGSIQHNPMPYYEVPREVVDDYSTFIDWAKEASEVAHVAKKRR